MNRFRIVTVGLAIAGAFCDPSLASARQEAGAGAALAASPYAAAVGQGRQRKQATHEKIDGALLAAVTPLPDAKAGGGNLYSPLRARVADDGAVQIYAWTQPGSVASAVLARAAGMRVDHADADAGVVQGWLAPDRLEALAAQPWVRRLTLPRYRTVRRGSVLTEGDGILRANALRSLGISGAGVRIGVISDGVESLADAQASGDLPGSIAVLAGCDSGDATDGECDEGTAMLEIIHDLAPGAVLGFCGPETSVEFIQCAQRLRGAEFDADIIVDDLGFITEPWLEDGPIAQDAAAAVAGGVMWASSAGNDGANARAAYYEAAYAPVEISNPDYDSLHDFGAASGAVDAGNSVRVPPSTTLSVVLQWSDAFGLSGNDYDLLLLDANTGQLVDGSFDFQNGDDDPIEAIQFFNDSGAEQGVRIVVARVSGAQNRNLKLFGCFTRTDDCELTYASAGGEIYGHPAVPGVIAVGAIDALDPGANDIEPFSSRGPVGIYVPSFVLRDKPDIAAIDGVSVTGAGAFPDTFFGTSAASPHVGALLALLMGTFDGDAQAALLAAAVDLGTPGRDNVYGSGRADVFAAAQALNRAPVAQVVSPAGNATLAPGESIDFQGTCSDPEGLDGVAYAWDFGSSGVVATASPSPGQVPFQNEGTFTVSLTCVDALNASSGPVQRTVTVKARGGGGGGGALPPAALFFLALAAAAAGRRRRQALSPARARRMRRAAGRCWRAPCACPGPARTRSDR